MGESVEYAINALAWAAGGFLLGYAAASVFREVHEIREAVVDGTEQQEQGHRERRDNRWIVGVIVIVLAVGSVTYSAWSQIQQQDTIDCQAEVNRQFSEALKERSKTAQDADDALLDLAVAVVDHPDTASSALSDFRDELQRIETFRQKHPYPELPEETCGD